MTITKKRVLKAPSNIGTRVVLFAPSCGLSHKTKSQFGLTKLKELGQLTIPLVAGPATRRNFHGDTIIHKDLPKELAYREFYWQRQQWAPGGGTEEVSSYVSIPYYRYPRTKLPAVNMELQLQEDENGNFVYATTTIDTKNERALTTAINVMLEIFGIVHISETPYDKLIIPIKADRRVNWQMLPAGKRTTQQLKRDLESVFQATKKKSAIQMFDKRLDFINKTFTQKIITVGDGGFHGYVAFTCEALGITILECIYLNNATYVFGQDWEALTQKTKTEILSQNLYRYRIIHGAKWENQIYKLLQTSQSA